MDNKLYFEGKTLNELNMFMDKHICHCPHLLMYDNSYKNKEAYEEVLRQSYVSYLSKNVVFKNQK